MLFLRAVASVLSDIEGLGVLGTVLVGGVGPVGNRVVFGCDVGGTRCLTGRLSHVLGAGVILAIDIVAEAGVLEGVFAFSAMNVGRGRAIEADSLSLDNFGVSRWSGEQAV